jgi:hypothetical protein
MPTTRLVSLGALLCCLSVAMPISAQPSGVAPDPKGADFGTTNLTHVRVSPFEFQAQSQYEGTRIPGLGWTFYGSAGAGIWAAPVNVPGGSLLKRVELDYCDSNTEGNHVALGVDECDNQWSSCHSIAGTELTSVSGPDCGFVSSSAVSQRIDNFHHSYVLWASFGTSDGTVSLGGAILSYQLDVSPAPGTPTFGDVPPSDPAFQYIEALVASGITAGCSGGNYCPDAPLTRRQMAVFLAKALGLQWAGY